MEDTRSRWERAFLEALDYDIWGQVEEAIEGYQRLQVAAAAEYVENVLQLPLHRREGIGKLAQALKLRIQELQLSKDYGINLNKMKALKAFLKEFIISDVLFPLEEIMPDVILHDGAIVQQMADTTLDEVHADDVNSGDGTLRPPPQNLRKGDQSLVIYIEKWGFKDAQVFADPHVVISVHDSQGDVLEPVQETPSAKRITPNYLFFESNVYIQTPINMLPHDAAIFFEFIHYKVEKKRKSVKCYCFIEPDEIRPGPVALEVYVKPANYKRNKEPNLLSVKPLYLHCELKILSDKTTGKS